MAKAIIQENLHSYLRTIGEFPVLSQEEEIACFKKIEQGDMQAKEYFIDSNLKLVVNIAKRYHHYQVPFMDLIQEGNLGLLRAVEKYDYHKGFRFSTYATLWIKQYIHRHILGKEKMIHIPSHVIERELKLRKIIEQLYKDLQREPSLTEIAEASHLEEQEIIQLQELSRSMISIDAQINEDSDTSLGEMLTDEGSLTPQQTVDQAFMHKMIKEILALLDEREKDIIICRYGLDGSEPMTLEAISKRYGVTRERVRQIENKAMRKLGSKTIKEKLSDLYYNDIK